MARENMSHILVCSLEPVSTNQRFDEQLPPHVVLQPGFEVPHTAAFLNGLSNFAYESKPIVIEPGDRTVYGSQAGRLPATTIAKGRAHVERLHAETGELIARFGGIITHPWSGDRYAPYVADVVRESDEMFTFDYPQILRAVQCVAFGSGENGAESRIVANYNFGSAKLVRSAVLQAAIGR